MLLILNKKRLLLRRLRLAKNLHLSIGRAFRHILDTYPDLKTVGEVQTEMLVLQSFHLMQHLMWHERQQFSNHIESYGFISFLVFLLMFKLPQ